MDMAETAVRRARERTVEEGLANAEFRVADFERVYFRPDSFDAVLCVFGIFFFADMAAALTKMWRYLRAGGRMVVVTRGPDVFEPGNALFWDAVRRERPELTARVVFSTGDTFAPETAALIKESGAPTVTKPFDFAVLERVIREVAAAAGPQRLKA